MNCKKCGALLSAEDQFCKNCGERVAEVSNNFMGENNNHITDNNVSNQPNINMNYQTPIQNNDVLNQPNMSYQSPVQNTNLNFKNKKNDNTVLYIIIGVLVVVLIVVSVFFSLKFKKYNNNETGNNTNNVNNNNGSSNSNNNSNNNNSGETIVPASSYKVKFSNFTFSIPDNMIYEVETNALYISDQDETWVVQLYIGDGNFSQIKSNSSSLQSYFMQNGIQAKPAEEKVINGNEYVTIELIEDDINMVGAYAKLNSNKFAWLLAYNQDNEIDYSIIEKIAPILTSGVYENSSYNISGKDFKYNINELFKFSLS